MNVTLEHLYPTLNRQTRESRKAYMGFLMWAVQDPNSRSVRLAARALGKSEGLLRRWKAKYDWSDRIMGVDQTDIVVLCFLRNLIKGSEKETADAIRASIEIAMPSSSLFQNLTLDDLQEKLADGIKLEPKVVKPPNAHVHVNVSAPEPEPVAVKQAEPEPPPEPVTPQVVYAPSPAASVVPDMEEVEEDFRQMRKLVQLGRAYILSQLREKKVKVTISDILTLQKAAFLMYGGPTESIALDVNGLGGVMGGAQKPPEASEAVGVKQARESGDKSKYLAAIQDDLKEQEALIAALIDDEATA